MASFDCPIRKISRSAKCISVGVSVVAVPLIMSALQTALRPYPLHPKMQF